MLQASIEFDEALLRTERRNKSFLALATIVMVKDGGEATTTAMCNIDR